MGESGQEVEAGEMRRFAFVRSATGMHSAQAGGDGTFYIQFPGRKGGGQKLPQSKIVHTLQ